MNRKSLSGPDDMWEWLPWDNGFVGMGLAVREAGWFLIWLFFSGSPGRVINSGRVRKKGGERLGIGAEKEAEKKKEKQKQKEIKILRKRERLYSHLYPHCWLEWSSLTPVQTSRSSPEAVGALQQAPHSPAPSLEAFRQGPVLTDPLHHSCLLAGQDLFGATGYNAARQHLG